MLDELLAADVRGRGGAGFPMGRKASFLPKPEDARSRSTSSSTPTSPSPERSRTGRSCCASRTSSSRASSSPAYTIGSNLAFIYLRGEYLTEYEVLARRSRRRARPGYVGQGRPRLGLEPDGGRPPRRRAPTSAARRPACSSRWRASRGQPRTKPPFPAISGLYASPTLINNVETLATVPKIIEMGGEAYARLGVENSAGTRVFSLSGNVVNGGNYELELGTTLRELIYDLGGGIPDGRELKAIIPGGSSVPVLTAAEVDTPLDFDAMAQAGTMLGSGAVIVIDDRCCMVQLGLRVAQFYMHESCGKCTPCREGTRWMVQLLEEDRGGRGHAGRARRAPERLRPDPRQLPLPARRRGGDAGRELRGEVPRRVPAPRRRGRLPLRRRVVARGRPRARSTSTTPASGTTSKSRRAMTTNCSPGPSGHPSPPPAFEPNERESARVARRTCRECVDERTARARHRHHRRPGAPGPEGHRGWSRRRVARDRDPGLLLRAAARPAGWRVPHVPLRGGGAAEAPGRVHADRNGRTGRCRRR